MKLNYFFKQMVNTTKTSDPIYVFFNHVSRSKPLTVSIVISLFQICLWVGISTIVLYRYPGIADVYFFDLNEFSFGFFLWGVFTPILWWYYLSLPKMWKDTTISLQQTGLVDRGIRRIIPERSFTILSLLLSLFAGTVYRFSTIPAEIALGRVSFWFVTDWTIIIVTCLVTINSYVFLILFSMPFCYLAV